MFTTRRAASPSGLFISPFVLPTGPGDELLSGTAYCSLLTLQVQHFLGDSDILLTSSLHQQPRLRPSLTKHPVHGTFLDFSKTHFPRRRIEFYGVFMVLLATSTWSDERSGHRTVQPVNTGEMQEVLSGLTLIIKTVSSESESLAQ